MAKAIMHDSAILDYSQAIALDPEFAKAYNYRGDAYDFVAELNVAGG